MTQIKIVTINILNDLSRWSERRTLLAAGLAELDADVIALQEVSARANTAGWLAEKLGGYRVYFSPKRSLNIQREGLAILSRLPIERARTIDLRSQHRVAQLVQLRTGGRPLIVANGHFYWYPGEHVERVAQIRRLLAAIARLPDEAAVAVCGDFNGTPDSEAIRLMRQRFRSAYEVHHGREPEFTCPTPLVFKDSLARRARELLKRMRYKQSGPPWRGTIDYIFVDDRVKVIDSQVVLDRPSPRDATLYPSDHFGVAATVEVA